MQQSALIPHGNGETNEFGIALADLVFGDASVLRHGWLPKLAGGTTLFLRADGTWALPAGGGLNPLHSRLTADATESAGALTSLSDLTLPLAAGAKYGGRFVVKCLNSQAAEGIQFDFNGGSATMTSFWAGASVFVSGGADTPVLLISPGQTGVMNWVTFTGESIVVIEMSMVVNAGGTFIPRAAENSHVSGTATFRAGSYLWLDQSSN